MGHQNHKEVNRKPQTESKPCETLPLGQFPNLLQYTAKGPDPPALDASDITPPLDCIASHIVILASVVRQWHLAACHLMVKALHVAD